jgi:hypothetical protein
MSSKSVDHFSYVMIYLAIVVSILLLNRPGTLLARNPEPGIVGSGAVGLRLWGSMWERFMLVDVS